MVAGDSTRSAAVGTAISGVAGETDEVSLGAVMSALAPVDAVWTGPSEPTIVTSGRIETITAGGEGRFSRVRRLAMDLFDRVDAPVPTPARPRLLGGFSFFGTESLTAPWTGFEPAVFHLPEVQVVIDDGTTWVTVLGTGRNAEPAQLQSTLDAVIADIESSLEPGNPGAPQSQTPGTPQTPNPEETNGELQVVSEDLRSDRVEWETRVGAITDTIRSGGLRKAVLAQGLDITADRSFDIPRILDSLGEAYPDCYRFAFQGRQGEHPGSSTTGPFFFGASPEQLVGKRGREVSTEALAGTVARGETEAEERELETQLKTSPKILDEHGLVVESIESQLAGVTTDITTGDRGVRKLATVQHLQVPLSARTDANTHILDVVEALHPTPAVGGLPPDAAKAVIRESETLERGWYAAPIGWFDQAGDGTFAVGIRSALAEGERVTLFAGNGIVADSDPVEEWDEVTLKFEPIRTAIR